MTKPNAILTTSSLVTILLVTLHMADDIVRQMASGNLTTLAVVVLFVTLWLYGTLIVSGRRSGYLLMILGSLIGLVIPAVHMTGTGISAPVLQSNGAYFFAWTLLALGASAAFTLVLAVRGLWGLRGSAPLE